MPGSWRIVQIKILGVFSQVRTCTCQHWLSISSFTTRKIFNTLPLELSQQSFWAEFSQPWRPCCMHTMANLVIASSSNKSKNTWKVSIGRLIRLSCMLNTHFEDQASLTQYLEWLRMPSWAAKKSQVRCFLCCTTWISQSAYSLKMYLYQEVSYPLPTIGIISNFGEVHYAGSFQNRN